jgi:hypothetical protein
VDVIEADLKNNQGRTYVGGPPEAKDQAWRWARYERAKEKVQQSELLTLKPGVWGINFDVRAALRRLRDWWTNRWR